MGSSLPFLRFLKIISRNGGLSAKAVLHTIPWFTKTILLEPIRWIEQAKYRKAVSSHEIVQDPVFILGHYRSGTTFLQRMFVRDKRFGYTSVFQTVLPEIMLTSERTLTPFLDWFSQTFRIRNPFHRIIMEWKEFTGEEDVGMTALLQYTGSQWGQLFPRSFQQYFEEYVLLQQHEQIEKWKQDYLYFLKKVSLQNKAKPLVLKNPPNTARIRVLLELFPKARFIHISRNPVEVFASTRNLWAVIDKNYRLGRKSEKSVDEIILYSYASIMDQYLAQKQLIPEKNLVEISYEDFIHDPVRSMRHIYERLDLFDFTFCEPAMQQFANQQKKYKKLDHQLDNETLRLIEHNWARHINYWQSLRTIDTKL